MFTTCYMIIILGNQGLARRGFLANLSQFPDQRLQSIYLVLYTKSVVRFVASK